MWDTLLSALALAFVLEGLIPFLFPAKWREIFLRMTAMHDGQIRFFGLSAMLLGLVLLSLLSFFR